MRLIAYAIRQKHREGLVLHILMDDRENGNFFKNESEPLGFARTQSYFDKSFTIRILIVAIFGALLFLFLHFHETYVTTLELGTQAKQYIVAQNDFTFPDEEATIILRQEAAHSIGAIYRIKEEEIQKKVMDFQKSITEDEVYSYEEIAISLSALTDSLLHSRFTTSQTIEYIKYLPSQDLPLPLNFFVPFIPGKEKQSLPIPIWSYITKDIFTEEGGVSRLMLNYFEPIKWDFERDQGIEHSLQKLAQEQIPEKYVHVRAGERLIDQGERVATRHIAMMQAMKEQLGRERNLLDPFKISGTLLMTLLLLGVTLIYLRENHKDIFYSNRKFSLVATILILALLFAKIIELFLIKNTSNLIDFIRFPLFIPFAAILLSNLINVRIAAFATLFLAIVYAMGLAVESVPFLVINILTALIAILTARGIRQRKEVFIVCGKAWLASAIGILAFNLYDNASFLTFSFFADLVSTLFFMALTAVLVVGLFPFLESTFRIMTDITLMEFMDPSNELLRRLTIEAPGTYQHSMIVGHLAEVAASAIGANGLFCRVVVQYHDIGKLANPQYFTENQLSGLDMHQLLTPLESAQVIIAHVSEGVALARKVGLPEQFIDIIKEHHGTTLVYYFYHKQLESMGGDKTKVKEQDFRYSGPKPRSKESTIIMIADTLEAASRSLDHFNEKTVVELVETLIAQKMADGQFDESLLTFEELGIVKQTLIQTLLATSHPRIKYPPHHPGEEG